MPQHRLMTVEEAARFLRVDPRTVYRLISDHELKAAMVGRVYRIDTQDLEDYLKKSKIKVQRTPKKQY